MSIGTTGPNGSHFASTRWGDYSMPSDKADEIVATLGNLAEFLGHVPDGFTYDLLVAMHHSGPMDRLRLATLYPREHHALLQWNRLRPLVDDGESGPTRLALLQAINTASNAWGSGG